MTYKGNQIDYGNLNDNLKTKIDKAEGVESQVQALTPKVDNSWQKGVYNDTDIINVGELNTSRVFHIKNWDAPTGNVEKVSIVIPAEIFSGTVKVSVTSEWGHTNGTGAFEYETSYSKSGNDVHLHNRTIYKADQNIATECYFPDFDRNNSLFSIPIVRKPNAKNWLSVKIVTVGRWAGQGGSEQSVPPGYKDNYMGWLRSGYLGSRRENRVLASGLACDCATPEARLKSDR